MESGFLNVILFFLKSLRWASCTLANLTTNLNEEELRMNKAERSASVHGSSGIVMVEKMSEVGAYMRRTGLEDWWRKAMGYSKGGQG